MHMDMLMKLKNTGKKIMHKINLDLFRKEILNESKKYIVKDGWNENLLESISKKRKYKINEITALFPEGYLSLLKYYLKELNLQMTHSSKNLNLSQMKVHERIREIILLRLKNSQDEKELIKKTYFNFLLPCHHKIALISLYETVDQIWFIARDNSTDFNFYSKRAILAAIYSSTVLHWMNNNSFNQTKIFLDNQLKKVSKIPQLKKNIKNISNLLPQVFSFIKNIAPLRQ